jgi:predicted amino acid dehydrogenase
MKKFAFLVHPRDMSDITRKFPILKLIPPSVVKKWILPRLKSGIVCSKFNIFESVEGYIVATPLTPEQLVYPTIETRKRILEAVLFTQEELDVELLGLGALTVTATDGGRWIIEQNRVRISITHGDSYAVAIAEDGIEKIIDLCELNRKKITIAIVGAYGIIGAALTKILAKNYSLILIGKSRSKLEALNNALNSSTSKIILSTELSDIYDADVVITATSHPTALLMPHHLKTGTVVYDIAQPRNTSFNLALSRPDILIIDGSLVNINGVNIGFDLGTPKGTTFACLVETIILTLEGKRGHRVGEISPSSVEEIRNMGKKYGFEHAPFTCFGRRLSTEDFKKFVELRKLLNNGGSNE